MPRGFTLMEVILVFSLIAIAAAVTLVSFEGLRGSGSGEPPEKVIFTAVQEARIWTLHSRDWTYLSYDPGQQAFLIQNADGRTLSLVELDRPLSGDIDPLTITFTARAPEIHGSFGSLTPPNSDTPLERVAFSPQRVSAPFNAFIQDGNIETLISFDPFSAMPMETQP